MPSKPIREIKDINSLRLDLENANLGTERGMALLEDSLREDGAGRSILVDRDGVTIAGAKTLEKVAELGIPIRVVQTDGRELVVVQRTDLDLDGEGEERTRARRMAYRDNRTGEVNLEWNPERLLADIQAGVDLDGIFYGDELDELLKGLKEEPPEDPGARINEAEVLRERWGVELGQVWELGDHRLACIDSTDSEAVAYLLNGSKAQLYATDPPYGANAGNIGFVAQRDDIEAITKDDLEGVEMQAFLERVFAAWIPHLKNDCAWYLWHPMLTQGYFAAAAAAAAADLIIHRQIIWKKEQFIFGRGDYHWRHELCFYGWRRGHRPPFYGKRNQDTVWEVPWGVKRSEIGHPTAKPPELFARPMRNHLRRGDVCAEPFCGSGSQIIAAEQHGVHCFAADIKPEFVALSIQRWVDMTGREPRLAS